LKARNKMKQLLSYANIELHLYNRIGILMRITLLRTRRKILVWLN